MQFICCLTLALALAAPTLAQTEVARIHGTVAEEHLGWKVEFVGDVDNDGWSDLAVASYTTSSSVAAPLHVYSGRTSQRIRTWTAPASPERFGYSLAGVGDLDGDGHDDVLVGASAYPMVAWGFPPNPPLVGGYAQLISGASGSVLHTFTPPVGAQRFGYAVCSFDDVDGDGTADMLIGAPGATGDAGYVYIYSGATFAQLRRDGLTLATNCGAALERFEDVTGDGIDEYAVGAPAFEPYNWTAHQYYPSPGGKVALIDGASGLELWSDFHGPSYWGAQLGWSLASLGDIDADGVGDLAVGMRDEGDPLTVACHSHGEVRVYSGATGAILRSHQRLSLCGTYGASVSAAGDIDGDGVLDYVGGEPGWWLGLDDGHDLRIFSGSSGQEIARVSADLQSPYGTAFGAALTSGDANGDGLIDLVVGIPFDDALGHDTGAFAIYTIVRTPTTYCESEINSLGCTPTIGSSGVCSASLASAFDITASNVLNQKIGFCFYGLKPRQTPFQGGFMCIVAPTKRTPNQSSNGAAPPASDCSGAFTFDFNARIQSGVDPQLVAGQEVFAQYWSRDPQDASTTNLTDALALFITP
ncbi:MAG: FG-GAP repeat protein [Planctomycetes bacterium]|nr:FG-GAP repeat protein [Planctomycetota bacterium]